ncbi:TolC family protein [Mucilaginibacter auburnensis]|uniref:Cobalt-zinc-cadmium efflux system outer membrane protein n=1 Tax=Mucilaginibacter auburnensis TaxID=1457233 RepID=A0A2H9VSQ2_9SPHI|nr:TolC family protein [Mucilaginibacter auburnensis]PJJ83856.1 cobalt-zinc-cadmium efflux system outer membrane protein [Mucilaginibacter auburnensis]
MKVLRRSFIYSLLYCLLLPLALNAQQIYNLKQALQAARSNNPDLKSARYDINVVQADVVTAGLRPNPVLNNQTLQLLQSSSFAAGTGWNSNRNQQVWWQLTKPFQLSGQRKYKIENAKLNVKLTESVYDETERNLFRDVALKWLDVWIAGKQVGLIATAKSNIDTLVSANVIRLRNQITTQTEVMRTQLLASQYELQLQTARQTYINEVSNLKYLTGDANNISVDTTENFVMTFDTLLTAIREQALQNRSDLVTARSNIAVADANIRLQSALAKPTPELGFIYNPQNSVPYAGIFATIELPFFSRNQGERQKSLVLKEQADQSYQALQQRVSTEVQTAYNSYQLQRQQMQRFVQLRDQARQILANVKYAYLRGGTTIIDFLEAQRNWLDTEQQYYQSLELYRENSIKLLYATGTINQLAR